MPPTPRKRASLALLGMLLAGLVLAGSAAAAGAQSQGMACCPSQTEAPCTWLGAGDCCPERPEATPPTQASLAAPAPTFSGVVPALAPTARAALPAATFPRLASHALVLRL